MAEGKHARPWTTYVIAIGVTVGGVAMLVVSSNLGGSASAEWWAGVLSNAGTAVIFVVPLYLVTRRLDRHVEAVRAEAVEGVEAVAAQVSDLKADVDKRIEDVARSVTARLKAEQEADVRAFDALATEPSRRNVIRALAVALSQDFINRPPRVRVSKQEHLYLAFDYGGDDVNIPGDDDELTLELRAIGGTYLDSAYWSSEESVENFMFKVGRMVQAKTGPSEVLDAAALFTGLANLLRVAATSAERRPIIQLCPPQWAVTEGGIVSYGPHGPYQIPVHRLRGDEDWGRQMAGKGWVNMESFDDALLAAASLFPKQDGPPF